MSTVVDISALECSSVDKDGRIQQVFNVSSFHHYTS